MEWKEDGDGDGDAWVVVDGRMMDTEEEEEVQSWSGGGRARPTLAASVGERWK